MKIRHLGIAVDSIEERLPIWESFGLKLDHTEKVDSEGVTTAHLKVGGYEIELLEPMGEDTPVGKFIRFRPWNKRCVENNVWNLVIIYFVQSLVELRQYL
jgi:hypothetical protein